jgi:hypothetical protein
MFVGTKAGGSQGGLANEATTNPTNHNRKLDAVNLPRSPISPPRGRSCRIALSEATIRDQVKRVSLKRVSAFLFTGCIIFPCGQLGPLVARAPVASGAPKPFAWIFHTRPKAGAKYPPQECRAAGRGVAEADTRRVSGLPRQFGRFRPIVDPARACFTRGCEICGFGGKRPQPAPNVAFGASSRPARDPLAIPYRSSYIGIPTSGFPIGVATPAHPLWNVCG